MNAPSPSPRFFNVRAWWHSLPQHRQDRLASFGPLVSVLLFGLVVVVAMSYLRTREIAVVRQALRNDGDYAHQFFSARLSRQREALQHAAQQLASAPADDTQAFEQAARHAGAGLPELTGLLWLDEMGRIIASAPPLAAPAAVTGQAATRSLSMAEADLLARARQAFAPGSSQAAVYDIMAPTQSLSADAMLGLMVPVPPAPPVAASLPASISAPQSASAPAPASGQPQGFLYARYSLPSVLYYGMPADIYPRYAVTLQRLTTGTAGAAATVTAPGASARQGLHETGGWLQPGHTAYTLPLPAEGLTLRLQTHHASAGLRKRMLLLVLALSGFTGWSLIANWRYLRRRQREQQALQAETNFRRAMENSIQTGMRAMDLQGRITYVNASFCQMTGLSEAELIGQTPPFSFWPPEELERNTHVLQEAFSNMAMRGGYEVRIRHQNGHVFDARTYITPLIGAGGQQTGWMSAMTDITEPKRIRRELAASQERFARVLDAIDTAVSVAPLGAKELLFANRFYRQWFGDDSAQAHMHILEQAASQPQEALHLLPPGALPSNGGGSAEIYLEQTQRWVEVRSRYLEWTDGRLAQLVVATDITARRLAEARSAEHEQRAHAANRLATMGEMASSVAHELNQPLTAIHNYCSGMRDRLASGNIEPQALLSALEKTAHQAQRAGQIIQRIREFVKRSAPNYRWVDVQHMVEDAVDLAEIEMRRRQVRLIRSIADGLPEIMADRILIEQVLVNLMKNAAEAIDNAAMPVERREVRLEVGKTRVEGKEVIQFALCDRGPGLNAEVLSHLFEAFFTTKAEGLGIGLNLCRSIVESHQGRLQAENLYNASEPQEVVGCCFSFWLPVQPTGI